jgi:hypothetical protein
MIRGCSRAASYDLQRSLRGELDRVQVCLDLVFHLNSYLYLLEVNATNQ